MRFLVPDFFNEFCELSLVNIHLFSYRFTTSKGLANIFEASEIFKPESRQDLMGLFRLLFDELEFLEDDLIFIMASRLVLLSQLDNMTK